MWRALSVSGVPYGGYFVKRGFTRDGHTSFWMTEIGTGQKAPIAQIRDRKPFGVSRTFETLGVSAIKSAQSVGGLVILDELGRFELGCDGFIGAVFRVLSSDSFVLGVIKDEPNPFLDRVEAHHRVRVVRVTHENIDRIFTEVKAYLETVKHALKRE